MSPRRSYSGKFLLRVGPELHGRLAAEASAAGLSLNEHCARRLGAGPPASRFASHGLDAEIVDRLVAGFAARPLGVVLFGSVARGEHTEASDMDLLIVLDDSMRATRALYREIERAVDLSRLRPSPSLHLVSMPVSVAECGSLWFEVALDGVILWEQGSRLSSLLREVRRFVAEGRMIRKQAYGHPYWVREAAQR